MPVQNRRLRSGLSIELFKWGPEFKEGPYFSGLAQAYVDVFSRRGEMEWGEDWDGAKASEKISEDLSIGESGIVALLLDGSSVAGFATAVIVNTSSLSSRLFPSDTTPTELAAITEEARKVDDRILFFLEFGIRHEYRGGLDPINHLTDIVLEAARPMDVRHMMLWTSKRISRIYYLCRSIFMWPVFLYNNDQEYVVLKAHVGVTRFFFSWGARLLSIFVGISLFVQRMTRDQRRGK